MFDAHQCTGFLEFADLETRFGRDNATTILRTLEQFEGIHEERVYKLSSDERLKNVFRLMKENTRPQVCH